MQTLGTLMAAAGHGDVLSPVVRNDAEELEPSTLADPKGWLVSAFNGYPTQNGIRITPDYAMTIAAVYACVTIISETIGSLPLHLYRRVGQSQELFSDHPLYSVLHDTPNRWQTAMEVREIMSAHLCLRGNAYASVVRRGGKIRALLPIPPDDVVVSRANDGGPLYRVNGEQVPRESVFHVRGLALNKDMLTGISPISYARESFALAKTMEQRSSAAYQKGLSSRAWVEHPGNLTREQADKTATQFRAAYSGASNAGGVAILDRGMKLHAIDLSLKDAELLLSRKFSIAEIGRIWRVPLHMLAELDKATFSNIEHQSLQFVMHTIRPWLVRWEQAIKLLLLTDEPGVFAKHSVEGLLRGDIKSRYEAYAIGRNNGFLNADEIRALEDRNPLPDGAGQTFLQPMNMTTVGQEPLDADLQAEQDPVPEEEAA